MLRRFSYLNPVSAFPVIYYLSHKVADRFRIVDRGYIREGYWADLVLVDLNSLQTVSRENVSYYCGCSTLFS